MQLTVKTLKGEKFVVEAEPSNTVAQVKTIIETSKPELPAANMKLIHSGKVLKDDDSIESCNIKPNAFLVVMISKAKKTAAKAPAPAPSEKTSTTSTTSAATTSSTPAPAAATTSETSATTPPAANTTTATSSDTTTSATTSSAAPTSTTTTTTSATTAPTETAAPAPPAADSFPAEMVANLTSMGFPEAEVRACLRASQGNPDVAVEYLMNGIPPYAQEIANASSSAPNSAANANNALSSTSSSSSSEPLAALRNHPQINQLRQLTQSNPGTLRAVLAQIGQQQPELLQEINANQELFLQIMNEPVGTGGSTGGTTSTSSSAPPPAANPASSGSGGGGGGHAAAMLEGMNNPAQMAQMIQGMNPEQLQAMAAMMGLSPDQLAATAQMISQMPQEDFQNYLNMAMQGSGGGGMGDLFGGPGAGGGGGAPPGAQVVRLTEEEMAAVDRLADMGFDRTEAAQAYLACDKNEALAANLLMDGGWGDADFGGGAGGPSGGGNNGGNDGDEDMYG